MLNITGHSRLMGVIGSPVGHSLSPVIHNMFLDAMEKPYVYMAFEVENETLEDFIKAAKLLNMQGFNVTMPLKEQIIKYIDVLDDSAKLYNSVNTVVLKNGQLVGYSTDGPGFINSLSEVSFVPSKGKALILGTGGAARTVAAALIGCGMEVTMASRRASDLNPFLSVKYCNWDDIEHESTDSQILINATPIGMIHSKHDFTNFSFLEKLPAESPVCDLIYAPRDTNLVKEARRIGHPAVNGLPLLVHQAALAFKHFIGDAPPQDVINKLLADL